MDEKTDQVMTVNQQKQSTVSISALCADSSTGGQFILGDSYDYIKVNKDSSIDVHPLLKDSNFCLLIIALFFFFRVILRLWWLCFSVITTFHLTFKFF